MENARLARAALRQVDRRLRQIEQRTGRSQSRYADCRLLHLALQAHHLRPS